MPKTEFLLMKLTPDEAKVLKNVLDHTALISFAEGEIEIHQTLRYRLACAQVNYRRKLKKDGKDA